MSLGVSGNGVSVSTSTPLCLSKFDMYVDPRTFRNAWKHYYGAYRSDRSVEAVDQVSVRNGYNPGFYFSWDVDTKFF